MNVSGESIRGAGGISPVEVPKPGNGIMPKAVEQAQKAKMEEGVTDPVVKNPAEGGTVKNSSFSEAVRSIRNQACNIIAKPVRNTANVLNAIISSGLRSHSKEKGVEQDSSHAPVPSAPKDASHSESSSESKSLSTMEASIKEEPSIKEKAISGAKAQFMQETKETSDKFDELCASGSKPILKLVNEHLTNINNHIAIAEKTKDLEADLIKFAVAHKNQPQSKKAIYEHLQKLGDTINEFHKLDIPYEENIGSTHRVPIERKLVFMGEVLTKMSGSSVGLLANNKNVPFRSAISENTEMRQVKLMELASKEIDRRNTAMGKTSVNVTETREDVNKEQELLAELVKDMSKEELTQILDHIMVDDIGSKDYKNDALAVANIIKSNLGFENPLKSANLLEFTALGKDFGKNLNDSYQLSSRALSEKSVAIDKSYSQAKGQIIKVPDALNKIFSLNMESNMDAIIQNGESKVKNAETPEARKAALAEMQSNITKEFVRFSSAAQKVVLASGTPNGSMRDVPLETKNEWRAGAQKMDAQYKDPMYLVNEPNHGFDRIWAQLVSPASIEAVTSGLKMQVEIRERLKPAT